MTNTQQLPSLYYSTIAVIGLGYVGMPIALEFSKKQVCCRTGNSLDRKVIGFDINTRRLDELRRGFDSTKELQPDELSVATNIQYTNDVSQLWKADVFIVTVPTPIDKAKRPDLGPLIKATQSVALAIKERSQKGAQTLPVIIYESTVYPGATEEICVPVIENYSGLEYNQGFFCGYSPERINPGDKTRHLKSIIKVTSGSTPVAAEWIDDLYGAIIAAGTHAAKSLKVAEAAKVIENTQRDLNIALVNELAIIFSKLGIDTLDVLEAAGSKWNFLPFRPGLVGGHCIGVDPYYLTHKAEEIGYHPQVVLAGRRINDSIGQWVAEQIVVNMAKQGIPVGGSSVLILGFTFKENCPDTRNTKAIEVVESLNRFSIHSHVYDPWASPESVVTEYGIELTSGDFESLDYQAIVVAVAHQQFAEFTGDQWAKIISDKPVFDLKGIVPRSLNPIRP